MSGCFSTFALICVCGSISEPPPVPRGAFCGLDGAGTGNSAGTSPSGSAPAIRSDQIRSDPTSIRSEVGGRGKTSNRRAEFYMNALDFS